MRAGTIATLFLVLTGPLVRAQSANEEVEAIRQAVEHVKNSADRRWEQIPWVPTLLEAREQNAETKRPVFLFTQEGNLRSGRC